MSVSRSTIAAVSATASFPVLALSAVITAGDPTSGLVPPTGPAGSVLFLDNASTGGGDTAAATAAVVAARTLDLNGAAGAPGIAGTVSFTGFGFATNATATNNTAESFTVGFIYFGADGVFGGGDDVSLGTTTAMVYNNGTAGDGIGWEGAGTYYVNFDAPISGSIDGLNEAFRITITPINGSIRFKTTSTTATTFAAAKLSVAGSFTPIPEPASMLALGAAGAALLLRRR